MIDRTRECAEYFRQTPGFERIMHQLLIRYRRNGHAAGTIRLDDPSQQERDALCGLFGRAFLDDVKFKVQDFYAALQSTRFEGVDLKDVLEVYFQTTIHTRRELKDGKIIGAVTHVLVNDPTTGYGIFIENMLDAAA